MLYITYIMALSFLFLRKFLADTFFTQFVLPHESDRGPNATSQNIWGDGYMGSSPPEMFRGTVPPVPLSLRPCIGVGFGASVITAISPISWFVHPIFFTNLRQ